MSLRTYFLSLFVISAAMLNLLEALRIFTFWWLPSNIYQIGIRVFERYGYNRYLFISQDHGDVDMPLLLSFAILLLITVMMLIYSLHYLYQNKGGFVLYLTGLLACASLLDMWLPVRVDWFPVFGQLTALLSWELWWDKNQYGLANISDVVSFIAALVLFNHAWQHPLFDLFDLSADAKRQHTGKSHISVS